MADVSTVDAATPPAVRNDAAEVGSRVGRAIGSLAFPIVLWWCSVFFLLGNLGLWLDDYGFHRRNPVTGSYDAGTLLDTGWKMFWRPLHLIFIQDLLTLTWNHLWVAHLVCAASHGAVVWLLFRWLRILSVRRSVASVFSMVFLTLPIAYEVPFWPSTISTSIATSLFLLAAIVFVRHARGRRGGDDGEARPLRNAVACIVLFLLTFLTACWYEQPVTAVASFPLLYLAVAPRGRSLRQHLGWGALPIGCAVAGGVAYVAVFVSTASAGARGSTHTLTSSGELVKKAIFTAGQVRDHLVMRNFLRGAVREGLTRLGDDPAAGVAAVSLLVLSGWTWLSWRRRLVAIERAPSPGGPCDASPNGPAAPVPARPEDRRTTTRGVIWVFLAGVAIFVAGWLPVVVVQTQWVVPRLCYVPMLGVMVSLAALAEGVALGLTRFKGMQRAWLTGLGIVAVPACIGGSLALIGVQSAFQKRWKLDQSQFEQLRRLVPAPSPHAVFMPVKVQDLPVRTGSYRFDDFARGVWELQWSANVGVKHAYRRQDVYGTYINRYTTLPVHEVSADVFHYRGTWLSHHYPVQQMNGHLVPWSATIPFTVDAEGQVRLVARVVFVDKSDPQKRVAVQTPASLLASVPGASVLPELVAELRPEQFAAPAR